MANMIQLDSEACYKFIYQFAASEISQLIHNRSRAHCGAKLFFEGHGRRFNPVDLLFGRMLELMHQGLRPETASACA